MRRLPFIVGLCVSSLVWAQAQDSTVVEPESSPMADPVASPGTVVPGQDSTLPQASESPSPLYPAIPDSILETPSPDSTASAVPTLPDTTRAQEGKAAAATVTIRAKGRHRRKEISSTVLTRKEANAVAATAQDPLRALPTLPGVTVASDLSVRPIVRGGDQSETGVELDWIPLLMPYHFGSVFSVFHREAIEDFQLYSGVAPARAEGALSGTVLARSRSAPLDSLVAGADISFLRGSGWVGVPVIPQHTGIWLSGQSMWYDWTVKRALDLASLAGGLDDDDVEEYKTTTTLPTNWDVQGGLTTRLTEDLTLDLAGFVSRDRYKVLEREDACFLDGREVPCFSYRAGWPEPDESAPNGYCYFYSDNNDFTLVPCGGNPSLKTIYDTSASVELSNWMVSSRLGWTPDPDLQVEAVGAFQKVAWDVRFPGHRTLFLTDSARNIWTVGRIHDSSKFDWRRTSLDLGLSVRKRWTPEHETSAGTGLARGTEIVRTDIDRTLAQLILGTTGNPLEFLGYHNEKEVLVLEGEDSRYLTMNRLESMDFRYDASLPRERENLWAEHRWDLDQGTRLRTGVRLSRFDGTLDVPNPRIQIQHEVGPSDLVGIGVALHTQSELPFEWRLAASEPLVSQKSWVGVVEWEHSFAPGWRGTISGWGKLYRDLASANLERYGKVDSASARREFEDWFWRHTTELGVDQEFWDRFRATPVDLPWELDSNATREEHDKYWTEWNARYNEISIRTQDSLNRELERVKDSMVPDSYKRDVRDWLSPRRLRYASTGEGWAAGLEASLRYQPTAIWNGWASAEWSMSRRKDRQDGIWYPFGLERPWKLAWVNAVKIDRAWELSVRYTALGGNPYTPFKIWDDEFDDDDDRDTSLADTALWIGRRNSGNFAPYQRLDLRLSRNGTFFGKPSVVYYEIWNALNEPNMILRDSETDRFRWITLNLPFPVVFLGFEVRF